MASINNHVGEQLADEQRMTKLGGLLRKYSLDELPQLINVLKGELSLIGPRPLLMEYLPLYSLQQAKRHNVKPGISGWAQVNGRNAVSWEEKFAYDIWYVENQSLMLDIKIIGMTIKKLLRPEGISQKGNVTMEKFKGQNTQPDCEGRDS
jgi:sugar transferase EpsL